MLSCISLLVVSSMLMGFVLGCHLFVVVVVVPMATAAATTAACSSIFFSRGRVRVTRSNPVGRGGFAGHVSFSW
jgi:uncharacterized membrane protein